MTKCRRQTFQKGPPKVQKRNVQGRAEDAWQSSPDAGRQPWKLSAAPHTHGQVSGQLPALPPPPPAAAAARTT